MKGRGLHIYALCYLLFLYAPILLLPIFAFNDGTVISFPLKGFTTKWFVQAFENATLRQAVANSQPLNMNTPTRPPRRTPSRSKKPAARRLFVWAWPKLSVPPSLSVSQGASGERPASSSSAAVSSQRRGL